MFSSHKRSDSSFPSPVCNRLLSSSRNGFRAAYGYTISINPLTLSPSSASKRERIIKSFSSTICANCGLISELTVSISTGISGAQASCRDKNSWSSIILMIRVSVGVKSRPGGSAPIPRPNPPKKLSSAEKIIFGSINTIDEPRSGGVRTVVTDKGGLRSGR